MDNKTIQLALYFREGAEVNDKESQKAALIEYCQEKLLTLHAHTESEEKETQYDSLCIKSKKQLNDK